MKYPFFPALILALSVAASGQAHPKTLKTKPVHPQKENKKPAPIVKEPKAQQDSAAAQLRRTEQSSAKIAGGKKGQAKPAKAGLAKTQREKPNPPIRFSAKGGGAGPNAKGGNELKGRLKQKGGSHHH